MSNIPSICSDKLKYMLFNAVVTAKKGVVDPLVYYCSRVRLFDSMHRFHRNAKKSDVKVQHLYVVPYSRYYTMREMLCSMGKETDTDEDDEKIKQDFREIMDSVDYASKQALEKAFFDKIMELKTPRVFYRYEELNKKILTLNLDEVEKMAFIEATSDMDILIADELGKDAALFTTRRERMVAFLKEYTFVNGWVTALSISAIPVLVFTLYFVKQ